MTELFPGETIVIDNGGSKIVNETHLVSPVLRFAHRV